MIAALRLLESEEFFSDKAVIPTRQFENARHLLSVDIERDEGIIAAGERGEVRERMLGRGEIFIACHFEFLSLISAFSTICHRVLEKARISQPHINARVRARRKGLLDLEAYRADMGMILDMGYIFILSIYWFSRARA